MSDSKPSSSTVDVDTQTDKAGHAVLDPPAADLVPAGPTQSAGFSVDIEDELLASAAWPRWPGMAILTVPLVLLAYFVLGAGLSVDEVVGAMRKLLDLLFDAAGENPLWGVLGLAFAGGVGVTLYAAFASLLNTSKVTLAQGELAVLTAPLPLFRRRRTYALSDIIAAVARGHDKLNRTRDLGYGVRNKQYALILRLRGNEEVTALWDLGTKEKASEVTRAINERMDKARTQDKNERQETTSNGVEAAG